MESRDQFTFYRSFWEALKALPKKDQLPFVTAVCAYALDGESKPLSGAPLASFLLVKPILEKASKKAANGKQGGSKPQANGKQSGSEQQSKAKQTGSEKENEEEKENEIEIEHECDTPARVEPGFSLAFTRFWESYPKKLNRDKAWKEWRKLNPGPDLAAKIAAGLEKWKICPMWNEDGGRYITSACDWLHDRRWEIVPPMGNGKKDVVRGASGELGQAELEAIQRVLAQPLEEVDCV